MNFLWQMENYFKVSRVEEEAKVGTTTMYSVDDPMLWWRRKREAEVAISEKCNFCALVM